MNTTVLIFAAASVTLLILTTAVQTTPLKTASLPARRVAALSTLSRNASPYRAVRKRLPRVVEPERTPSTVSTC